MIRLQIPQITTSSHAPSWFKNLVDEFLDHIVSLVNANRPFLPLIEEAHRNGAKSIYIFAPEVGGSAALLVTDIQERFPDLKIIILKDGLSSARKSHLASLNNSALQSLPTQSMQDPIEPSALVLSINHAHRLSDADFVIHVCELQSKFGHFIIGEGNNKSIRQVIGMTIIVPLVILLMTPMIRPLRLSRFIFTYMIPVAPLAIVWDGVAALFRIRSPKLLNSLSSQFDKDHWQYSSGKLPNNRGGFIIYLQGRKLR